MSIYYNISSFINENMKISKKIILTLALYRETFLLLYVYVNIDVIINQ